MGAFAMKTVKRVVNESGCCAFARTPSHGNHALRWNVLQRKTQFSGDVRASFTRGFEKWICPRLWHGWIGDNQLRMLKVRKFMRAQSQTHHAAFNKRRDLRDGLPQFFSAGKIGDQNFFRALLRQPLRGANASAESAKPHDKAAASTDFKFIGDSHWSFSEYAIGRIRFC